MPESGLLSTALVGLLLAPLLALCGRLLGGRVEPLLAIGGRTVALLLAALAASLTLGQPETASSFPSPAADTRWLVLALGIDDLATLLILLVSAVGLLTEAVAVDGRAGPPTDRRLIASATDLLLFAVTLQVLAATTFTLLVAWSGAGLAATLVVASCERTRSGVRRALISLQLGDLLLLAAVTVLLGSGATGWLTADVSAPIAGSELAIAFAGFGTLLAAASRLAVVPIHGWCRAHLALPGPAAAVLQTCMVVSGFHVLARILAPLEPAMVATGTLGSPFWLGAVLGGTTSVLAGVLALTRKHLHEVLGFSTVAHAGLALVAFGAGSLGDAVFHVLAHGIAKTVLILSATHAAMGDIDDRLRTVGARLAHARRSRALFVVSLLVVAGFPFTGMAQSLGRILSASLQAAGGGSQPWSSIPAVLATAGIVLSSAGLLRALARMHLGARAAPRGAGARATLTTPDAGPWAAGLMIAAVAAVVVSALRGSPDWVAKLIEGEGAHSSERPHGAELMIAVAVLVTAGVWWRWSMQRLAGVPMSPPAKVWRVTRLAAGLAWRTDLQLARWIAEFGTVQARMCVWFDENIVSWSTILLGRALVALADVASKCEALLLSGAARRLGAGVISGARRLQRLSSGRLRDAMLLAILSTIVLALLWFAAVSFGSTP